MIIMEFKEKWSTLQVKPPSSFTPQEIEQLTSRIQDGGTEVVQVKCAFSTGNFNIPEFTFNSFGLLNDENLMSLAGKGWGWLCNTIHG